MKEVKIQCPYCDSNFNYEEDITRCPNCRTKFSESDIEQFDDTVIALSYNNAHIEPVSEAGGGNSCSVSSLQAANDTQSDAECQDAETDSCDDTDTKCPYCSKVIAFTDELTRCPFCRTSFNEADIEKFELQIATVKNTAADNGAKQITAGEGDVKRADANEGCQSPAQTNQPFAQSQNSSGSYDGEPAVAENGNQNVVGFSIKKGNPVFVASKGKSNKKSIFSHLGKVFIEGEEVELCKYILQFNLRDCILDRLGQQTDTLKTLLKNMGRSYNSCDAPDEADAKFNYIMYRCLLKGILVDRSKAVPLYYDKELIASAPNELLRKIRERQIDNKKLMRLDESGALSEYMLFDKKPCDELMCALSGDGNNGYYHVSKDFKVSKINSELFKPENFLQKYDILKALGKETCKGFLFDTNEPYFYEHYQKELTDNGSSSDNDCKKLFYLLSVLFNEKKCIKIFGEKFSIETLETDAKNIILHSVKSNEIKPFVLLRALVKFKVFGSVGDSVLSHAGLKEKIVSADEPKTALKEVYYNLSDKNNIKMLYFDGQFMRLTDVAALITKNEDVSSALTNGALGEGLRAIYNVDLSRIGESAVKTKQVLAGCQENFNK